MINLIGSGESIRNVSSSKANQTVVSMRFCFKSYFCFKQKTAYEMRISDWSSDVCSSDLKRKRGWGEGVSGCRENPGPHPALRASLSRCAGEGLVEIGRASCRERVCQYV